MLVVRVYIGDTHVYRMACEIAGGVLASKPLSHDHRPVAKDQLRAMIADAQALLEAEDRAEPITGLRHIVVAQDRNDGCRGRGAILDHAELLCVCITPGSKG